MGTTTVVPASGDPYLDGLIAGRRWTSALTVSFPTQTSQYEPGYTDQGALTGGFSALNASQITAATAVIAELNRYIVAPVTFVGNNGTGDIRIANSDAAAIAYAYYPDQTDTTGGDVFIGPAENNRSPVLGTYGWHTMAHEIGHALGLKHPFEAGDEPAFTTAIMPADRDGIEFTVMSYRSVVGAGNGYTNEDFDYPTTYMQYDILALQYLYGADYTTNPGNNVYRWDASTGQMFVDGVGQGLPGANKIFLTVWDGNGHDVYDFTNYTTNLLIDLAPGGWSTLDANQLADLGPANARANVFNAFQVNGDARSLIEDARGGTGNDVIAGNQGDNTLFGNLGNDTIYGADGADFLDGYDGIDIVYGGAGNESIFGGADADTIYGGDGDDNAGGDAGNDIVYGGSGTNILQGWTGDDTLIGDASGDSLFGGDGLDTMYGADGADYFEGRVGNDTAFGGNGRDFFYGADGNDVLNGDADNDDFFAGIGNDVLSGGDGHDALGGEDGNDTLSGDGGNDALYGWAGEDLIFGGAENESIFGGNARDTIYGGDGIDDINGGDDTDFIYGDAGNDTLGGGGGNDSLFGGTGNDLLLGFKEDDRFVYSSLAGGNGTDIIGDFGDGADKVQLIGLTVASMAGTTAVLSDGSTLISGNGHAWIAGDFVI